MFAHAEYLIIMLTTIDYSCRINVTFEPSSVELSEVFVHCRGHFMCPISARNCVSYFPEQVRRCNWTSTMFFLFLLIFVKYIMLLRDLCVCCS